MQVFSKITDLTKVYPKIVAALGAFDGVHIGHQSIIRQTVQLARQKVGVVAIVSGTVRDPILTGKADDIAILKGDISLIASAAEVGPQLPQVNVRTRAVVTSTGADETPETMKHRFGFLMLLTKTNGTWLVSEAVEMGAGTC